jgi:uncharacterized membrane protein
LALAALREGLHSGAMANRNPFAIVGITLALIVGVVVAVSIVGTILVFLYGIVVAVFRSAFGIELPHLF